MSRYKHIGAIDLTRTEPTLYPTYHRNHHPSFFQKLRTTDTQSLISDSCTSMRNFCDSIQLITTELNRLLNSIETILPLLNNCLAQSRETIVLPQETITNLPSASAPSVPNIPTQSKEPVSMPTQVQNKQPKPEDVQQLLENPLVKNMLNHFMQNISQNKPS